MTIDEAIRILRQHNQTGASVMRITKGRATEMELLAQVLNRCEQNEVELKEAKRLLKAVVEDLTKIPCNNDVYIPSSCNACIKQGNCDYSDSFKWRYTDEALKLLEGDTNDRV